MAQPLRNVAFHSRNSQRRYRGERPRVRETGEKEGLAINYRKRVSIGIFRQFSPFCGHYFSGKYLSGLFHIIRISNLP